MRLSNSASHSISSAMPKQADKQSKMGAGRGNLSASNLRNTHAAVDNPVFASRTGIKKPSAKSAGQMLGKNIMMRPWLQEVLKDMSYIGKAFRDYTGLLPNQPYEIPLLSGMDSQNEVVNVFHNRVARQEMISERECFR